MDLRAHTEVVRRWWFIFVIGLWLALLLTFFSYYRVNLGGGLSVEHRQGVTWQSSEVLQLTQRGCDYCRAVPSPTTNLGWLTTLTTVYAQLANGAGVRRQVLGDKGGDANYAAVALQDPVTPGVTQFLSFSGTATTAEEAIRVTHRATSTFLAYLAEQSRNAGVSERERVVFKTVTTASPQSTTVIKGRKKTAPIVIFLAVCVLIFALMYALENLYPRTLQADAVAPGEERRPMTSPGRSTAESAGTTR